MYLWRFCFFLSACAATGYCLQCISCYEMFSDSCTTSTTETCLNGEVCIYQIIASITNGVISRYLRRSCAPLSECNVAGTFTYYNTSERIATTCCSNDSCTPTTPIVPSTNPKVPNGVMCSKCTLPGALCNSVQNMECNGFETKCLLVSTQQTTGTQTQLTMLRGCATSGYCIKNNMNYTNNNDVYIVTTYTCTSGISNSTSVTAATNTLSRSTHNGTLHCSFSLSAFVFLFILLMIL